MAKSRKLCAARDLMELYRLESQRAADPGDDKRAVLHWEHPLQIGGVDLHAGEARAALEVMEGRHKGLNLRHGRDGTAICNAAGFCDTWEVGAGSGVARLPAGLAIDFIVEHDD